MKLFWIIFISMISFSVLAMGVEERLYTVISKEGNVEIRDYQSVMSIEVTVVGSREKAASKAFRILVQFIKGYNETKIAIPMTAPVSQTRHSVKGWDVSFFMPATMMLSSVPIPIDKRIRVKELKQTRVAAIRFSGFGSSKNLAKYETKLREYLKIHDYRFDESPTYAFYNAPYVPPFFRRNEVLFDIMQ
ncbi:hypothetical protein DID74_01210 [Candidatus Marinamargulisbacteria bacterium SCGC AG-333-B06]|nr:hypothetical protein DID74_01210 [Candidatus Marinamargulisbacteria bacterium SCGC AG-333-B06]